MATIGNETPNTADIQQLMLESWLPVAQKHAEGSGGQISVLDIDPEYYPAQRIDTFHVEGAPQAPGVVEFTASQVQSSFKEVAEDMYSDPRSAEALDQAGELLAAGNNVVVGTNHEEITDVVMALAAVYNRLWTPDNDLTSALMVSKMISLLASNTIQDEKGRPVPGMIALQVVCKNIFMSYPKSETTKQTPLARQLPGVIKNHNETVKAAVAKKLGEGGVLLAMAPSGTTDKMDADKGTCTMEEVQKGTAELMTGDTTYVLPVAAHFGEGAFMRVCEEPRPLSATYDAHDVMRSIAAVLQANVSGVNYQYQ